MATINISGITPIDDPSYRYKMPKIIGKVEGRGNGIKTVLVNVIDIGQALNREAPEITKFFGCELGSQTTFSADTERAVVNGAHRDGDLQTHMHRYIENFVLCKNCRLPETHYKIKEGLISQKCLACGHKESVDMTHKLTAFILAQHKKSKEASKGDKKDKDKKDKKEKDGKKAVDDKKEDSDKKKASSTSSSSNGGAATTTTTSGAVTAKKEKKIAKAEEEPLGENVFGIEEDESDSKVAEDGMVRFQLWLTENPAATTTQKLDELRSIQTMSSLRPADRIIIFLGTVFTEKILTENQIVVNKDMLAALAPTEIQQRQLIAAFEWFCGRKYATLTKYFPVVLKLLSDEELVEEDIFFAWACDLTRNDFSAELSMIDIDTLEALKNSAAPFIKWLREAEEEDDDEEGNEEEDDDEEEEEEEG